MADSSSPSSSDPIKTALVVAGGSAALIISIALLAHYAVSAYEGRSLKDDPIMSEAAVAQRLKPVGEVVIDANAPQTAAATPASTPSAPAAATTAAISPDPAKGKTVYEASCAACHGAGVAGAPKFADKAAWAPRIAQGAATLHNHAIKGFQGKAGMMPPKGGNTALADADVIAAVDYLVSQAK